MRTIEAELLNKLTVGLKTPPVSVATAQAIYDLHRQWLSFTWPDYTAAMHRGLAEMYLADPRFQNYYDERAGSGATALLTRCIQKYAHD